MNNVVDPAMKAELERRVADLWRAALNVDEIQPGDEFLQLGGDSVSALQVVIAVWEQFEVQLPLEALFEGMTVASLVDTFLMSSGEPSAA